MTAQEIQGLAAAIHEAAVAKGFWGVANAKEKHVAKWRGELGEVIQADRVDVMYEVEHEGAKPEGVAAELADFVMMALDLFAAAGNDADADDFVFDIIAKGCEALAENADDIKAAPAEVLVNSLYSATEHITGDDDRIMHGMVFCVAGPMIWFKARGYDLWELIREKMAYNASRPKLHGRAY